MNLIDERTMQAVDYILRTVAPLLTRPVYDTRAATPFQPEVRVRQNVQDSLYSLPSPQESVSVSEDLRFGMRPEAWCRVPQNVHPNWPELKHFAVHGPQPPPSPSSPGRTVVQNVATVRDIEELGKTGLR